MAIGHIWEFYKVRYDVDWEKFFSKKACEVTGITSWYEYSKGADGKSVKTDKVIGSRIKVIIVYDTTEYKLKDNEIGFTNRLKELTIKIPDVMPEDVSIKVGEKICGSAYNDQGGFWQMDIADVKPYSTGGNGFMNDFSITAAGFKWLPKKDKK